MTLTGTEREVEEWLPHCTGLVLPSGPGNPVDQLRVESIAATAERALQGQRAVSGRSRTAAAVGSAIEALDILDRVKAFGTPYATWDAPGAAWALEKVQDPRPAATRDLQVFRHLCGAIPDELFVVIPGQAFSSGGVRLPWLGAVVGSDGPLAITSNPDSTSIVWDDGVSATLPTVQPGGLLPEGSGTDFLGGRLRAAPSAAGWVLEPATADIAQAFSGFGPVPAPTGSPTVRAVDEGMALLRQMWPTAADSVTRWVTGLMPLTSLEGCRSHASPTLRGVLLSSADDPLGAAEALCHEAAHMRLMAVLEQDPLLENAGDVGHPSPWRTDPRPLSGLLLGVHAFLDVCELHRRLHRAGHQASAETYARQAARVQEGWDLLRALAQPTAAGRVVMEALEAEVGALET